MQRRDLIRIAAVAAAAPHLGSAADGPRFFTAAEFRDIAALCDIVLPADEQGGGALAAGVPLYIDTIVLHADPGTQAAWRNGLADVARKVGMPAADLPAARRVDLVRSLAERESSPQTDAERLFVRLKAATIDGFFQSEAGMKWAGYTGNRGVFSFPGCTHRHEP